MNLGAVLESWAHLLSGPMNSATSIVPESSASSMRQAVLSFKLHNSKSKL